MRPVPLLGVVLLATTTLVAGCAAPAGPTGVSEATAPAAGRDPTAPTGATGATGATGVPLPASAQAATVVRGVDGDTVVLRGRGVGPLAAEPTKVRLLLIDTPEVFEQPECFGEQAADRTAALLPDGAQVRVEADRDPTDRFGRALLHVWTGDGLHVGAELVRGGYATVLVVKPNDRYLDALRAAEADARAAGRGLWSACR